MTCKICNYHKDFAEDSVLQGCDTSSSAGFRQPRFACMHVCVCVCVCKREKQLVAHLLFVDNTSISSVKMSLQDGKMGVREEGRVKLLTMCINPWSLNLRWLSQFLLQKRRRVVEAVCASRSMLCRIVKEVWKVVSEWHFQLHINWDQKYAIKRLR